MTNIKELKAELYPKVATDIDLLQVLVHGALSIEEMRCPDIKGSIAIDTTSESVTLEAEVKDGGDAEYRETLNNLKDIITTVQQYLSSAKAHIVCTWEVEPTWSRTSETHS